ncbi:MAG TPA: acyl-CoA dehydrogenase family protein [Chloroflexota bacterium]|nr:acyl-CoA dehydrogenase family protein [Chloroflexota bacterium]
MWWPKSDRQHHLISLAAELAARFARRAETHDRDRSFPHENFADLHRAGYLALTIPTDFGGQGASILEAVLAQERLARGDGATALGTAMHLSILGRLGRAVVAGDAAELAGWDRERYARVVRAVIDEGALINSAASEPETGSPSRGGRPSTRAIPTTLSTSGDAQATQGFTISGRKTFTTMAPGLRFILVSATIEDGHGEAAGQFLLEAPLPGLRIEETWDSMAMRATASHDLVLDNVTVPSGTLLSRRPYAAVEPSSVPQRGVSSRMPPAEGAGWALLIPAVYLGIATAARDSALHFATSRRPQPLNGKAISELPAIQRLIGDMEVALAEARALLFGAAEAWTEQPARRAELVPLLAAAKYVATNRGIEIADKAMRIVGGAGLATSHAVQRHFRDVRAGLYHPPMDDVALSILAKAALDAAG